MKWVQLSGAQKRKLAKKNQQQNLNLVAKTARLTHFFTHDLPDQNRSTEVDIQVGSTSSCLTTDLSLPVNSLDISTANVIASCFTRRSEDEIIAENESLLDHDEMIQSEKYEINKAKDPGLWLDFSVDDVAHWIACGPSDCQHHNGPYDKSYRTFGSSQPARYCSQKLFFGTKANGEQFRREWLLYSTATGSVYCFVCKLFDPNSSSHFVKKEGFSDWRNTIVTDHHKGSASHRDSMLKYLYRRQGLGLKQQLENQINEECNYWEHVLKRVIAVICTLAERGMAFRGTDERFGSLRNGNFLGIFELISRFDPFLAAHISKYGNSGKGNPSYLSKTTCEELIALMARKVHAHIVDEVNVSGYFSLSVDSTPDLSHTDQLSIVLQYLKDGKPIERFLTFLELKSHTGEEMANQVLQYLREVCKLKFSNCRGQSYDNAANMSGRYKGMQQKILEENMFAIYVPCAAHSLNLVGRSAVDCCQVAVNFFSTVQMLYTFFSASTSRWKILKVCIGNESVLKSLSNTRWEAHYMALTSILKSFFNILEALECLAEDQSQKGHTRREADNIANKMQELEFVFMLSLWDEILQTFLRASKVLKNEDVNLKTCADLYRSLFDQLHTSRDDFERFEAMAKEVLPDIDYNETQTRKRIRKKQPNDEDAIEVYLNARENFRITTFYTIIDKLESEIRRRGEVYKEIADRFSFLNDVPNNTSSSSTAETQKYSQCCQNLINAYPEDLNTNFSAELQQFHSYIRHKFSATNVVQTRFSHAELYKIIVEDNIECAFPNVGISLRIFLTLMVTNCATERSFSQLKHIKNPNRTTMQQDRLDALSVLSLQADMLREISFETLIKDFASKKNRKKLFNVQSRKQ